ncbi:MAG: hypothetical protein PSX80_09290 [bacterium]|nr:hypothetical protein [bacterium]
MLKIVLGVIAGFVAWSVLWLGTDQVLIMASPGWYGMHQDNFQLAMVNQDPFEPDTTILIMHLVRAAIISIMSGFLAAFIAGENRKTPLILGVLLLAFGLMVQVMAWTYLPIWYHVAFLGMLIPFTVLGGKIKKTV